MQVGFGGEKPPELPLQSNPGGLPRMGYCKWYRSSLLQSIEILSLCSLDLSLGHVTSGRSLQQRVCQACCCLLCQVKSRHYNTCVHVFVRAVEPVKCGTVILLQQMSMSADSARQCERAVRDLLLLVCIVEARPTGLASCSDHAEHC